jgi:hypothetical protein
MKCISQCEIYKNPNKKIFADYIYKLKSSILEFGFTKQNRENIYIIMAIKKVMFSMVMLLLPET